MAKSRIIAEIDLRRMEEQLERHLDRVYGKHSNYKGCQASNKEEWELDPKKLKVNNLIGQGAYNKEEWELDPKKLKVNNLIGQGSYGSVYKGVYDGKQVAVKILCLSNEKRRGIVTKAFMEEVCLWYNLDHPNIAKLIGASKRLPTEVKPECTSGKRWMKKWVSELTSHNPWARNHSLAKQPFEYCMVVEYVSGGTLRSHLLKNNIKKLPLKTVIQLALDVARGLSYLHSLKIVHRDVKTENLIMDKEGRVKIIDFGVSRIEASCPIEMTAQTSTLGYMAPEVSFDFGVSRIEASCPIEMTAQTGTPGYMAPEVFIGSRYDHKCDVYSFGICLWEIYCCSIAFIGQIPPSQTSPTVYLSRRPEIPNSCPSALANIMKQCWNANPKERPEMQEVVLMLEAIDTSEEVAQKGCFCLITSKGL